MKDLKYAPFNITEVISGAEIANKLESLIGKDFKLSKNPRTNGSKLRKLINEALNDGSILTADKDDYDVVPDKGKGVPRLLGCLCDSYIVTTGEKYNLQVWNRVPNSSSILIKYHDNENVITSKDIKFILVKVNPDTNIITTIIIATPEYIENKFGVFGVPTIKHQMIISDSKRASILSQENNILLKKDSHNMSSYLAAQYSVPESKLSDAPVPGKIFSLECIKEKVKPLIGQRLESADTKTKGQSLERLVATQLGYLETDTLVGGYPDIPNQLLEIKVQDSPTVDLGKYSPMTPEIIDNKMLLTTEDVRYLIALTNSEGIIEGIVLSSGKNLKDEFTFVKGTSFKCQRSIPMTFFDKYERQSVFNPE